MLDRNKKVSVKNRGTGTATYIVPDLGVRRSFTPGETKRDIMVEELEKLTFVPGGLKLMQKYLIISDKEVAEDLGLNVEPEYFYDEEQVRYLLSQGSIEQLLDCLDFAPEGVHHLIKKLAVETKLNDYQKREAIKKALRFDVTKAIDNVEYDKSQEKNEGDLKQRRAAAVNTESETETPRERRATTAPLDETKTIDNKYKVVNRG